MIFLYCSRMKQDIGIVLCLVFVTGAVSCEQHDPHDDRHLQSEHRHDRRKREMHVHFHMHLDEEDHHDHQGDAERRHCEKSSPVHRFAHCEMRPNTYAGEHMHQIHGSIMMSQQDEEALSMEVNLSGFDVPQELDHKHGLHVHEFGDMSHGCEAVGGMYHAKHHNHRDVHHGHSGDLGDLRPDGHGDVNDTRTFDWLSLGRGGILGRSLVVFQGNHSSHTIVACCVIGRCQGH